MTWQKPSPRVVWKAIGVYLAVAYDGAPADPPGVPAGTPSAVRARLETLRSTPDPAFYDCPVLERGPAPSAAAGGGGAGTRPAAAGQEGEDGPSRYALRLGNRAYPHMKLVIERSPDGRAYLLRADTHDTHITPKPGSREYAAFQELAAANRTAADGIEAAWEAQGLPTFKKYLRDDLERRRAAAGGGG